MIVRGYDPKGKRSRLSPFKVSYRDIFAFLLIAGLFALIIYLSVIDTSKTH